MSEYAEVAGRMRTITSELEDMFLERADAVRGLMVSVLAGQHSLLLGPPGTAKSALARELTGRFDGAQYWEILLTKFTAASEIFGPVDVGALARGQWTQVYEGRATTAHIGFIDEVFKGSAAALNSMLTFLNERVYHPESGGRPIACPLISAVCASNELGSGDELSALYDRLLVRLEVGYLSDPSSFATLLRSAYRAPVAPARTVLGLDELQIAVTKGVPAVTIPDGVIEAVIQLRAQLRRKEHIASDRRWKAAMGLIQASAFLAGRAEATTDDLMILASVLWDSVADRPIVEHEVLQLVNPAASEALTLADAIDEVEGELNSKAGQSEESLNEWAVKEAVPALRRASRRLSTLLTEAKAAGRPASILERTAARCAAVQGRIMVEVLGVNISDLPK